MKKNSSASPKETKSFGKAIFLNLLPYFLLTLLCIAPFLSFFHTGLPITHDGKDHVARIANFYLNLQEGVLIPRWAQMLNWGYGHPILMFLYPFPSYFASFFHFLGFSFIDSVKLVFGVSFVLSGYTMYLWVSKFLDKCAAFFASVLYLFAPYRFIDIHVRGAIGEHVAFIFPPLVLYFLWKLSQKKDVFTAGIGAVCLAGLFLSHNAISIMFLPVLFLYALYMLSRDRQKKAYAIHACIVFVLGFMLSAFFLFPALLEGKYTLRDIVTNGEYSSRFVPFHDFIFGEWSFGGSNSISKQIGVIHWIMLLSLSVITLQWFRKKNSLWMVGTGVIALFLTAIFIMTDASGFIWSHIKILQNFQFPWRFLSLAVFLTAISGALVIYTLPKKIQATMVIALCTITIFMTATYWGVNGYLQKTDNFFAGVYEGTTDTGESAPIWSIRFMEKRPKQAIEIIDGKAAITPLVRKTTNHSYHVDAQQKTRIRENTLYFPGWEVLVDGAPVIVEFQDTKNRGLITFYVEKGSHTVEILFKDTKIRLFSNILSLLSLVIIGIFCIMKIGILWKRSQ